MDIERDVLSAESRIRAHIRTTILEYSYYYSRISGANVFLKLENLQHTGSFKVRGALNKILSLSTAERERGIITASTGNHGAAVAFSSNIVGTRCLVYAPHGASQPKIQAVERLGASVQYYGDDCVVAEQYARKCAVDQGMIFVSPYNDPEVVAGQGTIGVELESQMGDIHAVFVSVGGGGLISGVAGYLKSRYPHVEVIGCSPANSDVMIQSQRAGRILDLPSKPTLSDGTAGGLEPDSITFELCRRWVDDYVTVTESQIRECLRTFIDNHHLLIEGAAAVAIAGFLQKQHRFSGKNVMVILCGANIGIEALKDVLVS